MISWQASNVWRVNLRCRWSDSRGCTAAQAERDVTSANRMLRAFVADLRSSGAIRIPAAPPSRCPTQHAAAAPRRSRHPSASEFFSRISHHNLLLPQELHL